MQGDTKRAVEFLKKWEPEGPWTLTSISPDKKSISTETFTSAREKEMSQWIGRFNGERNMYFSVNAVKGNVSSKATKEEIQEARWLHVDVDPADGQDIREERERVLASFTEKLPKGLPDPTVIIFSGGGYQAFWKLSDPFLVDGDLKKAEEFELYNKRLEQIFGGDHCHNVDRIMRLPGTVNIPDAKKRKKGRVEELAVLLQFTPKSYPLSDFKKAAAVQTGSSIREGGEYGDTRS
jgi:RepB DNA-primase from phage plasmid